MYEYFEGVITVVTPSYVVVDVGGVGYKVYSPTPFAYTQGQKAKVFIEQVVRDTGITLYGFQSQDDKGLFLKLLSVSGIGPKSAMAIMAAEDSNSLAEAIEQGEVKYLTRFPGVGKKTASQIVLDLKGKLGDYVARLDRPDNGEDVPPALNDALLALRMVWMSTAKKASRPAQDTRGLLKEANRLLTPSVLAKSRSR